MFVALEYFMHTRRGTGQLCTPKRNHCYRTHRQYTHQTNTVSDIHYKSRIFKDTPIHQHHRYYCQTAGISQITTGSGISKPVIRGLGYNRVLVVNDGIRQEGQQWGDEHGVEIDAQNIHSVEILKGPASLIYGSTLWLEY